MIETESSNPDEGLGNVEDEPGEELMQEVSEYFSEIANNLSPQFKEKFQDILDKADTYYEYDKEGWTKIFEDLKILVKQFEDLTDETEFEEAETLYEDELEGLWKKSQKLTEKGTIH